MNPCARDTSSNIIYHSVSQQQGTSQLCNPNIDSESSTVEDLGGH